MKNEKLFLDSDSLKKKSASSWLMVHIAMLDFVMFFFFLTEWIIEELAFAFSTVARAVDEKKETVAPLSNWAAWAFYLMPADKLEDGLACLEELYTTRFLPMYNGDKKKADRMFKWQIVLLVLGNHYNKLKYCLISLVGVFGLPRLLSAIKNWIAF